MSISETAHATLAPIMPPEWTLSEPRRRGPTTVELQLHPPEEGGLGVGIEWSEGDGPAYATGPRYKASYRRGPGLVDLSQGDAPESLRALALAACDALAALLEGLVPGGVAAGSRLRWRFTSERQTGCAARPGVPLSNRGGPSSAQPPHRRERQARDRPRRKQRMRPTWRSRADTVIFSSFF